jgi:hypothetical protein
MSEPFQPYAVFDSFEEYHGKHEFFGSSGLEYLYKTPAHYLAHIEERMGSGDEDEEEQPTGKETKDMLIGSAYHCLLAEPSEFRNRYEFLDKEKLLGSATATFHKKENQEKRDRFLAQCEAKGVKMMMDKDYAMVVDMVTSARKSEVVNNLLMDVVAEKSHYIYNAEFDLYVKIRPDFYPENKHRAFIGEAKSDKNVDPRVFRRTAYERRYHARAAFILDHMNMFYKNHPIVDERREFKTMFYIVTEKKAPYFTVVFEADEEYIEIGRHDYRMCLTRLKEAKETGTYKGWEMYNEPDNNSGIILLSLPEYATKNLIV